LSTETIKEEFKEKFKWIVDLAKGRKDIKSRVAVLANPDNLKTMSILKRNEADFVVDAFWLAKTWGFFDPMRDYAKEKLEVNISIEGQGREQAIRFVGALSETKLLQKLGVSVERGETKEK